MDPNDINQFLSLFIETAGDRIRSMRNSLLLLENDSHNIAEIEKLHRDAHSLKGECNAMKFQVMAGISYLLQQYFLQLMSKTRSFTASDGIQVKQVLNALEISLESIKKEGHEADLSGVKRQFQAQTGIV